MEEKNIESENKSHIQMRMLITQSTSLLSAKKKKQNGIEKFKPKLDREPVHKFQVSFTVGGK